MRISKLTVHFPGVTILFGLLSVFQPARADVSINIAANIPSGAFAMTGTGCAAGGYSTPQTLQWAPGASCTVSFVYPTVNRSALDMF